MGLNMITKSLNYHNLSEPEGHEHCVVIEIRPIMSEHLQILNNVLCYKKIKDTKGVITSCKSKDRQCSAKMKKTNNDLQNTT
jgi:hypothetical protein